MNKRNINVKRGVNDVFVSRDFVNSINFILSGFIHSIRSDQINLVETKEKSSEMESSMLHRFHIVDGRNLKTVIGKTLQHRLTIAL
jgi:hypothetical protein